MFNRWECNRCNQTFSNVRKMWRHKCPAIGTPDRTAMGDARRRHVRELDRQYRETGRRERVRYV